MEISIRKFFEVSLKETHEKRNDSGRKELKELAFNGVDLILHSSS